MLGFGWGTEGRGGGGILYFFNFLLYFYALVNYSLMAGT